MQISKVNVLVFFLLLILIQCDGQIVRHVLNEADKRIHDISRFVTGGLFGGIKVNLGIQTGVPNTPGQQGFPPVEENHPQNPFGHQNIFGMPHDPRPHNYGNNEFNSMGNTNSYHVRPGQDSNPSFPSQSNNHHFNGGDVPTDSHLGYGSHNLMESNGFTTQIPQQNNNYHLTRPEENGSNQNENSYHKVTKEPTTPKDETPNFVALAGDGYKYDADGIKVNPPSNTNTEKDSSADEYSIDIRNAFD